MNYVNSNMLIKLDLTCTTFVESHMFKIVTCLPFIIKICETFIY